MKAVVLEKQVDKDLTWYITATPEPDGQVITTLHRERGAYRSGGGFGSFDPTADDPIQTGFGTSTGLPQFFVVRTIPDIVSAVAQGSRGRYAITLSKVASELRSRFGGCVVPDDEFIETVTGWDADGNAYTVAGPTGELISRDVTDDNGWLPAPKWDDPTQS